MMQDFMAERAGLEPAKRTGQRASLPGDEVPQPRASPREARLGASANPVIAASPSIVGACHFLLDRTSLRILSLFRCSHS